MNQICRVCGEAAAGYHFGAFTCEGCKSFFGRTYNNLSSISECKNGNQCVINRKNRTSCKACRLRKCLLVGMSKSGSRYGRRSNWFKIHCLLQEQNGGNNNNNIAAPESTLNPASALAGVLYQNAFHALLPGVGQAVHKEVIQGSVEDVRSTPDSAASSMLDDASYSKSPSPSSDKQFINNLNHLTMVQAHFDRIFSKPFPPPTLVDEDEQQDEPIDLSIKSSVFCNPLSAELPKPKPLDLSK